MKGSESGVLGGHLVEVDLVLFRGRGGLSGHIESKGDLKGVEGLVGFALDGLDPGQVIPEFWDAWAKDGSAMEGFFGFGQLA